MKNKPLQTYWIPKSVEPHTIGPRILRGHYVYEWLDSGIPFYIGSGINRRAWNTHNDDAELQRKQSTLFQVVIHSHFLTKQLSHVEERILTQQRIRQGFKLTNQRKPQC